MDKPIQFFDQCPNCKKFKSKVVDSRYDAATGSKRRRRQCSECGYRWNTYEINETDFKKYMGNTSRSKLDRADKTISEIIDTAIRDLTVFKKKFQG